MFIFRIIFITNSKVKTGHTRLDLFYFYFGNVYIFLAFIINSHILLNLRSYVHTLLNRHCDIHYFNVLIAFAIPLLKYESDGFIGIFNKFGDILLINAL